MKKLFILTLATVLLSACAEEQVEVDVPEILDIPEIVAPTETPEQGSLFALAFKDIGADSYSVWVGNCTEYNNDGINPCLDDATYTVSMKSGQPEIDAEASVIMYDELIIVKSNFELKFEEEVIFSVTAQVETEDGFTSVSDELRFTR